MLTMGHLGSHPASIKNQDGRQPVDVPCPVNSWLEEIFICLPGEFVLQNTEAIPITTLTTYTPVYITHEYIQDTQSHGSLSAAVRRWMLVVLNCVASLLGHVLFLFLKAIGVQHAMSRLSVYLPADDWVVWTVECDLAWSQNNEFSRTGGTMNITVLKMFILANGGGGCNIPPCVFSKGQIFSLRCC